jgi:DNA-binding NarL/FixJ family response regulator
VLTPLQLLITSWVAEGLQNREIAVKVGTTEHVIKNHLKEIYDKTGMWTRLELALWYVEHFW